MCCILDTGVTERLLLEPSEKLTLEDTIEIVRASETSKAQVKQLRGAMTQKEASVHALSVCNKTCDKSKVFDCHRCGKRHGYRSCGAYGHKCKTFAKMNHYESCCKSKNRGHVNTVATDNTDDEEWFVEAVTKENTIEICLDNLWYETLCVNKSKQYVNFKLDTGAQANIISLRQ